MSRKRHTVADEAFMLVRTSAQDLRQGALIAPHRHPWHQLVYVSTGLAVVTTAEGTWMAPPAWSVWVPAQHEHSIRLGAGSTLRTLYLRPGWPAAAPAGCRTCAVSPLLRELLVRAVELGMLDERDETCAAIARLIVAELPQEHAAAAQQQPFRLPQPASRALLSVVRRLEQDAPEAGTADLARAAGLSVRTLERRFLEETGMSLGRWRQQLALLTGLEQIATGATVKAASFAAGYRSPSAFVAAFARAFGTSPGRYLRQEPRNA
jgi:AraC-like DNA-binding protein